MTLPPKYLVTDQLRIAYLEAGPSDGQPVLLLHGFPDDATAWLPVMERIGDAGYRGLAPFLRGVGNTRFNDDAIPRAGDFAALGSDALAFVNGLGLRDCIVVGHDWGSPTAEIVAMLEPERVRRLIKLNWYGVYSMAEMSRAQGFAYQQLRALWYVWMLNTPLGEMVMRYDLAGFARTLWAEWSPSWDRETREAALAAVVPSFANPDYARVALSAYRGDVSEAERDPTHEAIRDRLTGLPPVECETLIMTGADDGVERSPLSADALSRYFRGGVRTEIRRGVGHFPQREAPDRVAAAIMADALTHRQETGPHWTGDVTTATSVADRDRPSVENPVSP